VNCHWNQEEEKEARKLRCRHLHYYIHFLVSFGPFFSRNRLERSPAAVCTLWAAVLCCWPQVDTTNKHCRLSTTTFTQQPSLEPLKRLCDRDLARIMFL
jgi:hypothetical protein